MNNTGITLKAGGERKAVSEAEAREILARFEKEVDAAATAVTNDNGDDSGVTTTVTTIDLSCRSWHRTSLEILRPVLERVAPTVKFLKLDDVIASLPTAEGLDSLAFLAEIFENSPITDLNLDDNALGSRGDQVLLGLFRSVTLERLSLENCGMSQEVAASLLTSLIPSNKTHISLGRNQIGAVGASHVGTLLGKCPKLVSFKYNGARPLPEGTAALLRGLADMAQSVPETHLEYLNLHDCTVGKDNGNDCPLTNLVMVLQKSPRLTYLNLADGEIGVDGLKRVLEALEESGASLTSLALGGCGLGEEGAEILADRTAAGLLAKLESLQLDTNELGDAGMDLLIPVLATSCPALCVLDLESNELERQAGLTLVTNKLPALRELNLTDNPDLPKQIADRLAQMYPTVAFDEELEEDEDLELPPASAKTDIDALAEQFSRTNL